MDTPVSCIGFILDGNRRWAKERGLPSFDGHTRGFENLKTICRAVQARGIPHMAAYAFSTENWSRSPEEVSYLMGIFRDSIRDSVEELGKENMRVRFIGQRERFEQDMQDAMRDAEERTSKNTGLTLWFCLSYGGRAEITAAAALLAQQDIPPTEEALRGAMWSAGMPDPDIIVRTSGERRLSNFLIWQAAYSELFFVPQHWPDFDEVALDAVLAEYSTRQRRHGK